MHALELSKITERKADINKYNTAFWMTHTEKKSHLFSILEYAESAQLWNLNKTSN